jgi:hypothetical protein
MQEVTINGETFQYDVAKGVLHLHIREPFYSAGKQFHWLGAPIGLGISKDALMFALQNNLPRIQVTVGSDPKVYEIETVTWLNLANDHNSKMVKGNTEIYVVQWSKAWFKRVT